MKKIFVFLMMCVFAISILAQEDGYKRILCDCHINWHYGLIGAKNNDTIVYVVPIEIYNDNISKRYFELHYDKHEKYSKEVLDTIENINIDHYSGAKEYTYILNFTEIERIGETFKYGYIKDWSWSLNSVNGIGLDIAYTNTNKKTIKYIDIYFIIKNPVGDICRLKYNNTNTGHLRCVGPIEELETGRYSWDAVYYTTGDASNMYFKKFVITYMDGSKYTLVKELAYKYYPYDE